MITASTLPEIAFSKNEITLELNSTDYNTGIGQLAVNFITFNAGVALSDGNTIRLRWAGGDITFTAVFAPDGSGEQLPVGSGDAIFVASLVPYFAARYEIARDFDVIYATYYGLPSIKLTAKSKGPEFNITGEAGGAYISVLTDSTGVKLAVRPNLAHHLQLWIKLNGVFKRVWQANLQLDFPLTGKSTKNIAPILHPYLVQGFANNFGSDRPSLVTAAWQACNKTLLEYYLVYAQFYGDTPTVKKLNTSPTALVNIGGLDIQTATSQTLITFLRPDISDDSKTLCLRQGSKTKKVQPLQPEFLYWINLTGSAKTVKVEFELFYNEGGSVLFFSVTQNVAVNTKYAIPVGYTQAGVVAHLPINKTPAFYTTRLVDNSGSNALSVKYTFQLDGYRQWPRYFVYRNALGGFETLYTWGKGQLETEIKADQYELQTTDVQAAISGRKQQANIRLLEKTSVFTGYTTSRDVKVLKDFFAAEEKYLVDGSAYVPIILNTDSLKEAPDGDNLNGASFEFTPKYDEMVYTDDPSQVDNVNSAYVPVLHPIYVYSAAALPASHADLAGVAAVTYANMVAFATGNTYRMIIIGVQDNKNLSAVINTSVAAAFGNITSSFNPATPVATFPVAGVNYNFFALIMGVPYPNSQNLEATFI